MMRWTIPFLLALSCVGSGPDSGQPPHGGCAPPEELRGKYLHESMYLTYIPLNDMTQLLNDSQKFEALCQRPPGREVLTVFRAFLNRHRESSLSQALAFLQLNLATKKSGFKKMSDNDGAIKEEPWSAAQVDGIACFCDRFLNAMLAYETTYAELRRGTLRLDSAWDRLRVVQENPYIPEARASSLAREFGEQMEQRPDEINDIRRRDRIRFEAMDRFKQKFDASLREIDRDARRDVQLEPLIGERGGVSDLLRKFSDYEERKDVATGKALFESLRGRPLAPAGAEALERNIDRPPLRMLLEGPMDRGGVGRDGGP